MNLDVKNLNDLLQQADKCRDEVVAILQDLVRIPSVNTGVMPTGNEMPVCEYVAARLGAEGIASQIVESAPGRGNIVARLPGSAGAPRLMLMSHTDVVPVENETEWTHPPFSGDVAGGRVHGRGSSDIKCMVASEMMAMLILKRAGVRLKGDLILAACADEEAGGAYGAGWMAATHPELVQADFAVNEGGGGAVKTADGGLAYFFNTGEKGRYEVAITVAGRSWHAARPWMSDNPLYKVTGVIKRIQDYRPEIDTSAPMFTYLQGMMGLPEPITNANVDRLADGLVATKPEDAAELRACSRMTLTPTMIKAGIKSNSIAERVVLTCDIRTLPGQDTGYVQRELERILAGLPDVSWELTRTATPSASPADHPFAASLRKATAAALGRDDFAWAPGLTTGFTDSRLIRPLGTIVYDFAPAHPDADPSLDGAHNKNESQDIASLVLMTRMFLALAWDVLS